MSTTSWDLDYAAPARLHKAATMRPRRAAGSTVGPRGGLHAKYAGGKIRGVKCSDSSKNKPVNVAKLVKKVR